MLTFWRTAALAALAALGGAAQAQEGYGRRGDLAELSHVLGESQALRELCEGKQDQYWRSRMMRLLALEEADGAAGAALTSAFNAGYSQARQGYSDCGPGSRRAEVEASVRGQELSAALAGPAPAADSEPEPEPADPDDVAEPFEPR